MHSRLCFVILSLQCTLVKPGISFCFDTVQSSRLGSSSSNQHLLVWQGFFSPSRLSGGHGEIAYKKDSGFNSLASPSLALFLYWEEKKAKEEDGKA